MPPFFASVGFARELERAECDLLIGCAEAIATRRSGVVVIPMAGGVAAYTGKDTPLNKVGGLGFDGLPTDAELSKAESMFFERGERTQVEVSCLADVELGKALTKRGYELIGYENVLVRPLSLGFEIRGCEAEVERSYELEGWLDTVVDGFMAPDEQGIASPDSFDREALRRVIADMDGYPPMRRYLARIGGQPVGGASVSIGERFAQLCGASTLPEHRRKGVQTTLLHRRLIDAAEAGCEYAVVATLPGSKSQMNVQKHGFEHAYTKAIFVLEPKSL